MTLISLEKACSILTPTITVFYEILCKAVPQNFDALDPEKSLVLSDLSSSQNSSPRSRGESRGVESMVEDQLLTDTQKSIYLLNYLYSFITIN